jgi:hypothetical protein
MIIPGRVQADASDLVASGTLDVAEQLLGIALELLGIAFGLEALVVGGIASDFLGLAGHLVAKTLGLFGQFTHDLSPSFPVSIEADASETADIAKGSIRTLGAIRWWGISPGP